MNHYFSVVYCLYLLLVKVLLSCRLKYTEMEMRNRQVNHARNLWDRAVTILPRVSQFWYKFTYMEEMLENVPGARQVSFVKWILTI